MIRNIFIATIFSIILLINFYEPASKYLVRSYVEFRKNIILHIDKKCYEVSDGWILTSKEPSQYGTYALMNSDDSQLLVHLYLSKNVKRYLQNTACSNACLVVGFSPSGYDIYILPRKDDYPMYWLANPDSPVIITSSSKDVLMKYESFLEETSCDKPWYRALLERR